jgi:glyoxylase-like metal-dependent hydrolase (beta-lactamase superfamily II)
MIGLETLKRLGITVLERGWLSSNCILMRGSQREAALVDTGYATHAEQTVALVGALLDGRTLARIINTHLHSDHCGGNAALCAKWNSRVEVPAQEYAAASSWNETSLTFRATDQRCDRFPVHGALAGGSSILLGGLVWEVHGAPGHDPDAIMLFEPKHRILISGDALWERRVSVIFPELEGKRGFADALQALDAIERMAPQVVIPGHGRPFDQPSSAIQQSRERLHAFAKDRTKHERYAVRALTMFHMLEHRRKLKSDLAAWIRSTPALASVDGIRDQEWLNGLITGLEQDGVLRRIGEWLYAVEK